MDPIYGPVGLYRYGPQPRGPRVFFLGQSVGRSVGPSRSVGRSKP